jgi:hypothetical protein
MQDLFRYDLPEEDTIVFSVTDNLRHTPERELIDRLSAYIARHDQRLQQAEEGRPMEMEALSTEFARLLLQHLESGKTPPQHKSYTLKS